MLGIQRGGAMQELDRDALPDADPLAR